MHSFGAMWRLVKACGGQWRAGAVRREIWIQRGVDPLIRIPPAESCNPSNQFSNLDSITRPPASTERAAIVAMATPLSPQGSAGSASLHRGSSAAQTRPQLPVPVAIRATAGLRPTVPAASLHQRTRSGGFLPRASSAETAVVQPQQVTSDGLVSQSQIHGMYHCMVGTSLATRLHATAPHLPCLHACVCRM
jgi:hypothetical protein